MVKRKEDLYKKVHKKIRPETIKLMVETVENNLILPLQGTDTIEENVYAFLYYNIKTTHSFDKVEKHFELPHSTFNTNYLRILSSLDKFSDQYINAHTLTTRKEASKKYIKFPDIRKSTLIMDTKVFTATKIRGVRKGHLWWWGKTHSRGIKVLNIFEHNLYIAYMSGPHSPYKSDSKIVEEEIDKIQQRFQKSDVYQADIHFNPVQKLKKLKMLLKYKKPKRGVLTHEQQTFNNHHMNVGLSHLERLWGSLENIFERLKSKVWLDQDKHFKLVRVAAAIHNLQRSK